VATSQLSPRSQPASLTLPPSLTTVVCCTTGTRRREFDLTGVAESWPLPRATPRCAWTSLPCGAALPIPATQECPAIFATLGVSSPLVVLSPSYHPVQSQSQSHCSPWPATPPTPSSRPRLTHSTASTYCPTTPTVLLPQQSHTHSLSCPPVLSRAAHCAVRQFWPAPPLYCPTPTA